MDLDQKAVWLASWYCHLAKSVVGVVLLQVNLMSGGCGKDNLFTPFRFAQHASWRPFFVKGLGALELPDKNRLYLVARRCLLRRWYLATVAVDRPKELSEVGVSWRCPRTWLSTRGGMWRMPVLVDGPLGKDLRRYNSKSCAPSSPIICHNNFEKHF